MLLPGGEFATQFARVDFAIIKSVKNLHAFESVFGSSQGWKTSTVT